MVQYARKSRRWDAAVRGPAVVASGIYRGPRLWAGGAMRGHAVSSDPARCGRAGVRRVTVVAIVVTTHDGPMLEDTVGGPSRIGTSRPAISRAGQRSQPRPRTPIRDRAV